MKLEIETPTHLIDVNHPGMNHIEPTTAGGLRIGALVRNADLAADERIRRDYAVLSRALLAGASAQLRNQQAPPEIYSSVRVAPIFMTLISRVINASLEVVAPHCMAKTANWQWSAPATPVLPHIPAIWP